MFNILFVAHYYLFIMFNSLFLLLKHLFPVAKTSYLVFKKYFKKILCKHKQVWSWFEDLIVRNIMVKSKYNLDTWFGIY